MDVLPESARSRICDVVFEIMWLFLGIELYIWKIKPDCSPMIKRLFLVFLIGFMANSWDKHGDTLATLGLKPKSWQDAWLVALITLFNIVVMGILSRVYNYSHVQSSPQIFLNFLWYLMWAPAQQLIINGFFTNRLAELIKRPWIVALISGTLFAIVHLPNPALTMICLVNGILGAYIFIRSRNIWLLAISHACIGALVAPLLPWAWHHALKIGTGF